MKWAGHVAGMEEQRKVYKALVGKARRKDTTRKTEDGVMRSEWIFVRLAGGM
jgi:hypothetical protein